MPNPWRTKIVIDVIIALVGLYLLLFVPTFRGWGYAGPDRSPSFWSFTSIDIYGDASVRAGSRSGPGIAGGGK